jgi:hypothetical protein
MAPVITASKSSITQLPKGCTQMNTKNFQCFTQE